MITFHCQDCEHYRESLTADRRKLCDAAKRKVWPGDAADECPHLVADTPQGRIAC